MSSTANSSKSHAFSIILIMIVLMVVGAACIPMLSVQYRPVTKNRSLTVSSAMTHPRGESEAFHH